MDLAILVIYLFRLVAHDQGLIMGPVDVYGGGMAEQCAFLLINIRPTLPMYATPPIGSELTT